MPLGPFFSLLTRDLDVVPLSFGNWTINTIASSVEKLSYRFLSWPGRECGRATASFRQAILSRTFPPTDHARVPTLNTTAKTLLPTSRLKIALLPDS